MATRFEIVLHGDDPRALRAAGEEALDEVDRLEAQLSLYRAGTEIANLNARASTAPVRVTPAVFHLLERARSLSAETQGVFDITVAPLVRCWGFMGGGSAVPDEAALAEARGRIGMNLVALDAAALTVRFSRDGVMLDLGAIGKGYAIDRAAEILREAGVHSALIHGGTSSTFALGRQANGERWKVAITSPRQSATEAPLAIVELEDESLSVSAVWGRYFQSGGRTFGHIIDPRTGAPADNALLAAVILPSATDGDALSTALLTAPELMGNLVRVRPEMKCLVISGDVNSPRVVAHGVDLLAKNFESGPAQT
jgi:thiamine biosynthesis lipoprotein